MSDRDVAMLTFELRSILKPSHVGLDDEEVEYRQSTKRQNEDAAAVRRKLNSTWSRRGTTIASSLVPTGKTFSEGFSFEYVSMPDLLPSKTHPSSTSKVRVAAKFIKQESLPPRPVQFHPQAAPSTVSSSFSAAGVVPQQESLFDYRDFNHKTFHVHEAERSRHDETEIFDTNLEVMEALSQHDDKYPRPSTMTQISRLQQYDEWNQRLADVYTMQTANKNLMRRYIPGEEDKPTHVDTLLAVGPRGGTYRVAIDGTRRYIKQ